MIEFTYTFSFAQAPEIQWQNTIGGKNYDELYSVIEMADGGYLLGGYSYSGISGDKTEASEGSYDYWVVKLDGSGNIEWQNTIGGSSDDDLQSVIQTADGGYLLGGYSHSGISGEKTEASQGSYDYWLVKLDGSGNIEWQNTIGGSYNDILYSVIQTADGGYLLGGYSISGKSGDKTEKSQGGFDYWVVKLDGSGNIEWQNTIGGSDYDFLYSIIQTTDGGYLLGGDSYSGISGDKSEANQGNYDYYYGYTADYWVVKLDGSGNIEWQNTIGGDGGDYLYSVIQTAGGGYLLGGYSESGISGDKTEASQGDEDYWVVKLEPEAIGTGITSTTNFIDFSVFPNPDIGRITIQAKLPHKENLTIKVLDLAGKGLYSKNFGNVTGIFSKQLDLSNFSVGTYLVLLVHNGKKEVKKLVIQK
ncbi:MAG: T9SS type A sorting domain-containing protein [Chitinophagales bacterium]|nr:T9SS type A sorting domain-containing protein [Chitinophagales bacterium]